MQLASLNHTTNTFGFVEFLDLHLSTIIPKTLQHLEAHGKEPADARAISLNDAKMGATRFGALFALTNQQT